MYKLIVLAMIVCVANGGLIGHGVAVAPAAIAVSHGATSWQNNNQISLHPVPVVAKVAVAAPVVHAAPIAVAHAPIAVGLGGLGGLGHGLGLGIH